MASKEVSAETKAGTAVAASANSMFAAHAGAGLQNVGVKDIIIPRITILQGLSPQVTRGQPEYNPDAKVGQIFDTGLNEIIGDSMLFLPVAFKTEFLEWWPREAQKGLEAIHQDDSILAQCEKDDKGRLVTPKGTYVQETAQFFGLNLTSDKRLSFLPFASTQLKKARQINTFATNNKLKDESGREFTPPLFYQAYMLSTVPESNAKGNWMGWKVERGPLLQDLEGGMEMFEKLLQYSQQVTAGDVRGDVASTAEDIHNNSEDPNGAM